MSIALYGGIPQRKKPFPRWPVFDDTEVKAITKVVKSGKWWRFSYGEGVTLSEKKTGKDRSEVAKFQERFAELHGCKYGIATSNGTASMEIALRACDVGPGDEIIVPAYTYVASATVVLYNNAVPVFVDIDPDTYNIDPDRIESAITDKTKGIMVVHFGGQIADMEPILNIAKKHNLQVYEDAAHAHGSMWRNKMAGSIGVWGSFSFQESKNMTAGEGGIITTNDGKISTLSESLVWAGREKGRPWYEVHRLGSNYRLTEFQGALLSVQLTRLEKQNKTRMNNAKILSEGLSGIEGIKPLKVMRDTVKHSYHIYMFRFNEKDFGTDRGTFIKALVAEGIPVFSGYTFPLYKNPMFLNKSFYKHSCPVNCKFYDKEINYADFEKDCPVTERACKSEAVWITQNMLLGDEKDMKDIIEAVWKVNKYFKKS